MNRHIRRPNLAVLALALAATLAATGCTTGDSDPSPSQPTASETVSPDHHEEEDPHLMDPLATNPISAVTSHTYTIVGALGATAAESARWPVVLEVDEDGLAGTTGALLSEQEKLTYQLRRAKNQPAYRVCIKHEEGPWASYDSATGSYQGAVKGPCSYQPSSRGGQQVAPFSELTGSLTMDAQSIASALAAGEQVPADLDSAIADLGDLVATENAELTVWEPTPKGVTFCVSGALGGWARHDGGTGQVMADTAGECPVQDPASVYQFQDPTG